MQKTTLTFCLLLLFNIALQAQTVNTIPDSSKQLLKVEASCGSCKFGMPGSGCELAVRIDGKSYFVDGTTIDDHGNAHADDGFCEAIRNAEVQGEIVNDRFQASYFKLLPEEKKEKKKKKGK